VLLEFGLLLKIVQDICLYYELLAMKNGVAFGRPKSIITEQFKKAYQRWKLGEMTAVKAMQEIGVKKTTFYRLVKGYEKESKNIDI
jgi:hypothetical protein